MKKIKLKLKDIQTNKKFLDLRPVNSFVQSRYQMAYRNGADMPLMILTNDHKVCSGNHRFAALCAEYPEEHEVTVNVLPEMPERELLEFFVKENSTHGHPLDGISKKRIAWELISIGASEEDIAKLFNVAVKNVIKWGEEFVFVRQGGTTIQRPVKRGFEVDKSQSISQEVYTQHIKRDRGVSVTGLANQIIRWIDNGLLVKTEKNEEVLAMLRDKINQWFEA